MHTCVWIENTASLQNELNDGMILDNLAQLNTETPLQRKDMSMERLTRSDVSISR